MPINSESLQSSSKSSSATPPDALSEMGGMILARCLTTGARFYMRKGCQQEDDMTIEKAVTRTGFGNLRASDRKGEAAAEVTGRAEELTGWEGVFPAFVLRTLPASLQAPS